jgi:DNA-binding PadR family transcriptional regulator
MLRQMEESGWVDSTWDNDKTQGPPRRMYQLTDAGRQKLAGWRTELTETRGMIDELLKEIK